MTWRADDYYGTDERPERGEIPNPAETAAIEIGSHNYTWRVVSDCGVVKIYSSRDGCMVALNPASARGLLDQLYAAVDLAADLTEIRSYGKVQKVGPWR